MTKKEEKALEVKQAEYKLTQVIIDVLVEKESLFDVAKISTGFNNKINLYVQKFKTNIDINGNVSYQVKFYIAKSNNLVDVTYYIKTLYDLRFNKEITVKVDDDTLRFIELNLSERLKDYSVTIDNVEL